MCVPEHEQAEPLLYNLILPFSSHVVVSTDFPFALAHPGTLNKICEEKQTPNDVPLSTHWVPQAPLSCQAEELKNLLGPLN